MRILYLSNVSTLRCGVAELGRQNSRVLRELGHDVTEWDGNYPVIYDRIQKQEPSYFPADWASYDVIHLNWHPTITNHYVSKVFPPHPLISIFLHDIPPHTTCTAIDQADVIFSLEPTVDYPQAVIIPPAMIDYVPMSPVSPTPLVGRTSVGDINRVWMEDICQRHGWELSNSGFQTGAWTPIEDELERLARCWVNVVWYEEQRSRSSAAITAAFARRPLLLSNNTRFDNLRPYSDELYFGDFPTLEACLVDVMRDVAEGVAKVPRRLPEAFGWRQWSQVMVDAWDAARTPQRAA